jgi:hypothetical protein
VTKKKKKDVTLNRPTFPNGLKDFHEMTHAAEALSGLLAGGPAAAVKNEKSSGELPGQLCCLVPYLSLSSRLLLVVNALLNPCMCRSECLIGQLRCSTVTLY